MVSALNEIGMVRPQMPAQAPSQSPNFRGIMPPAVETSGSVANNMAQPVGVSPMPQGPLGANAIDCKGGKLVQSLNIVA